MPADPRRTPGTRRIPKSRKLTTHGRPYMTKYYKIRVFQDGSYVESVKRALTEQSHTSRYWLAGSKDENGRRPLICRYNHRWYAVKSTLGDFNNPAERKQNKAMYQALYIELPSKDVEMGAKLEETL